MDKPEKGTVAEHGIETGHRIDFSGTSVLRRDIRINGSPCKGGN
jgi:hypothetical protein